MRGNSSPSGKKPTTPPSISQENNKTNYKYLYQDTTYFSLLDYFLNLTLDCVSDKIISFTKMRQ